MPHPDAPHIPAAALAALHPSAAPDPDPADDPQAPAVHLGIPEYLPIPGADPKPWWQSRGVVGAMAVIIAQIMAFAGVQLDAGTLTALLLQAVSLIAGIIALIGRVGATQPIR